MKYTQLFTIIGVLFLAGAGCQGGTTAPASLSTTIDRETGSAKAVFPFAEQLVKERYPNAILAGFNNYTTSFARENNYPDETDRDTSGETPYWVFIFAKEPAAIADDILSNAEAVAIEFYSGTLTLIEEEVDTQETQLSGPIGADEWQVDTDDVFNAVLQKIQTEFDPAVVVSHVDFNLRASTHGDEDNGFLWEITLWTSENAGYDAKVDPETGKIGYTRAILFQ